MSRRLLLLLGLVVPTLAGAHSHWVSPAPRAGENIKIGPCGNAPRGSSPMILVGGQDLTVNWSEFVDHTGYFLISFSASDDTSWQLLKRVEDDKNGSAPNSFSTTITVPRVACEACTFQLIQVMTNTTPPTNYYSCFDAKITLSTTAASDTCTAVTPTPTSAPAGAH